MLCELMFLFTFHSNLLDMDITSKSDPSKFVECYVKFFYKIFSF